MNRVDAGFNREQGVALLTVVLIISIVTVLATAMASRQQMDIRRAANVLSIDQLDQYSRGAEAFAQWGLHNDISSTTGEQYDTPEENWAIPVAFEVENGGISGQLIDLNRYLNINNLVDSDGHPVAFEVERMKRLFRVLGEDDSLVDALIDWIDADQQPYGMGGAEDDDYLLMDPPYRAANRMMHSISELKLVRGFTLEVRKELVDDNNNLLLTVLPNENSSKVNVNSAPWQIIQASLINMSGGDAQTLEGEEYETLAAFMDEVVVNQASNSTDAQTLLDVSSNYFLLTSSVMFGERNLSAYSLLKRDNTNGKSVVVYRGQGVY